MPLSNNLKEYRAKYNVNQTEIGNLVGVSRQTISQIERQVHQDLNQLLNHI